MNFAKFLNLKKLIFSFSLSLNDCKIQLRSYLNKLELDGLVTQKDGYQNIVTAVAKDLCNKGKYRLFRNKELQTLQETKHQLEEKYNYYKEQVEYYNQYIQRCLENLHTGKGYLIIFILNYFYSAIENILIINYFC